MELIFLIVRLEPRKEFDRFRGCHSDDGGGLRTKNFVCWCKSNAEKTRAEPKDHCRDRELTILDLEFFSVKNDVLFLPVSSCFG